MIHLRALGYSNATVTKIDTPVYTKPKNDIEGELAEDETLRQLARAARGFDKSQPIINTAIIIPIAPNSATILCID